VAQARQQVLYVSPPPSSAHAQAVVEYRLHPITTSDGQQEHREIDPCVDGELQGSPEATIHLHQMRPPGERVDLVLDHGDALPTEAPQ
jgi:hypothetical protein